MNLDAEFRRSFACCFVAGAGKLHVDVSECSLDFPEYWPGDIAKSNRPKEYWWKSVKVTMFSATFREKAYAVIDCRIVGYYYNDAPGTAYALSSGVGNSYGIKRA